MSCPFFEPLAPRSRATDSRFATLPLGDSWDGLCLADPASPVTPDPAALHALCNLGYARQRCPRFPSDSDAPDAIRFSLSRGAGPTLHLRWAIERDHHPHRHGVLEFSPSTGAIATSSNDAAPLRHARAYIAGYLRRLNGMEQ